MKYEEEIYEEQGYITLIGELMLDSYINEEKIDEPTNSIRKLGLVQFHIYPDEGPIPHIHIFNKNHEFETCLKITKAQYFSHGGKYKSRFSNKQQLKDVDNWLNLNNSSNPSFTNWETAIFLWNLKNKYKIDYDRTIKPNYKNIK